jgi:hypothetical protein
LYGFSAATILVLEDFEKVRPIGDRSREMALLKRELCRQVKGPEVTHADCCKLIFDTDTKHLYVEREMAHLKATVGGVVDYQTATSKAVKLLGTRELSRFLRTLFSDTDELVD